MFSSTTLNHDQGKPPEPEDIEHWRGVFVKSLRRVLEQVHPSLTAGDDALDYVERLIIQLLGMLCQKPSPHTIADVEERVRTTFPTPIDKWALEDAREALEKFKRRTDQLVLPVERIHQMLQKEVLQYRLDLHVIVFITAVLEYISADLFKLTGNYVKNIHHVEITCQDIRVAMCADKVLADMFTHNGSETVSENDINLEKSSYESAVKDFIHDEKQHLRNLNMISKVFFEEIRNVLSKEELETLQNMFQNLNDISDLTFSIVASFEDILEMSEDKQSPLIGSCLEEFAEDEEFEVYSRFTNDIIQTNGPERLVDLLSISNRLDVLTSAGQGFREAAKYYLPKLLRYPIWHCFAYFDYIKIFQEVSEDEADKENLEQLEGLLKPLKAEMTKLLNNVPKNEKEYGTRLRGKLCHGMLMEKVDEMKKTVDGFASKYSKQYCMEILREDTIMVQSGGKRMAERRATLFDGMLVLSKRKRSSSASGQAAASGALAEYKLKDLFFTRKVEIKDREDTDEIKNAFEIVPREQLPFVCVVRSFEEKCLWMSDLIMLNIKCMLDRSLNSVLDDIERKNPLQMPPLEKYRFAEHDSPSNIVFEGSMIKGATLLKLVERLTYHVYTDALFDKTFLITYRTFTTAQEVLDLLIERYRVPEVLAAFNIENINSLTAKRKEDIKRYRKQYYQPIQFRVLNVLKRWVDCYFHDFENDVELLDKINDFLDSITEKSMKKWAVCVKKILQRKRNPAELCREMIYDFDRDPPAIEWHVINPEKDSENAWREWNDGHCVGWKLLVLHPVEIARQLTLIEYDMYKAVRSSELIGAAWTKDNKEETAPHVIKIMRSTTNFTLWLEKTIVETENLEERVALVTRILEIMTVLLDLNNFNGVFSTFSALQSACVFRLTATISKIPPRLDKVWKDVNDLFNHQFKTYIEKLRCVNPPCVPFFGVFLTKLMHVEEGNTDFLNEQGGAIINFSKRRFITEIISEIQRFQDQPYCLTTEPKIKEFLESMFNIYPFDKPEPEVFNDLYQQSLKIEPKEPRDPTGQKTAVRKPLVATRKWPDLNLKSPGIKLRNASQSFKFSHIASGKPFLPNDDLFSGLASLPVSGIVYSTTGRKFKFNSSTNLFTPVSASGPASPSREMTVFTPIFFGSDVPSSANDNSQSISNYQTDSIVEGPPLPPRVNLSSPIIPPRVISPPPLPPRRDSLHVRQSSADAAIRAINPFDHVASSFGSSLSGSHLSNTPDVFEKPRFNFPPTNYQFSNVCLNEFDAGGEAEMNPDDLIVFPKTNDLVIFEDPVINQNFIFDDSNEEKSSTPFPTHSNQVLLSPGPNQSVSEWSGLSKFGSINTPLSSDRSGLKPLPKNIVFPRRVRPIFQFNAATNGNQTNRS